MRSIESWRLKTFSLRRGEGWFWWLSFFALLIEGTLFLTVAIAHAVYPGFTETMEGDILQHIERAAHGQPIYPPPGAEYIALTYMPLYYYLAAPFYVLFGDSLFGPRLLSILATLGSLVWVARITYRETHSLAAAMLAMAFFCAGYRIMDASVFLVHPDPLLLFWVLTGYWFWAYGNTRRDDILWLLCFTLAFWTKQHGAFFFGWAVLYALFFRANQPRSIMIVGILLGGPVAYFGLGHLLGERFFYHTLIAPRRWEHNWWFSLRRMALVIACFAPLTSVTLVAYGKETLRQRGWKPTRLLWFTLTCLATCAFTMTISGASNNHYVPYQVLVAIILAIVCHGLATSTARVPLFLRVLLMAIISSAVTFWAHTEYPHHDIPVFVPVVLGILAFVSLVLLRLPAPLRGKTQAAVLILAQLAVDFYLPGRYLPSHGWTDGLAYLQSELKQLDAPVIWISYGNVPGDLTGTKLARSPSWVALEDIARQ